MKCLFVSAIAIVFASMAAHASGLEPSYSMAEINSITRGFVDENGLVTPIDHAVDKDGNANFVVEYVIQPCAQSRVSYLLSPAPKLPNEPFIGNAKYFALGVLVMNKGIACAGPTVIRKDNFKVTGGLSLGGAVLRPIK